LPFASRSRARDLGLRFDGRPGKLNALTDVPGVEVGTTTLADAQIGVTAILPRGRAGVGDPCAAGRHVLNGNGEMTGTAWIDERGALDLPVLVTSTHAVGPCHRGAIDWIAREQPELARSWLLPVVAETWNGYLCDAAADHIHASHAVAAIDAARGGPVEEGGVGGGAGMCCYGFAGGTGTASRVLAHSDGEHVVGVLVQANYGARRELTLAGLPAGRALADDDPMADPTTWAAPPGAGSVIAVLATDAPLLPGQCAALARRVPLGLARTGTSGSHFSGDLFLAFSTANPGALVPSRGEGGPPYGSLRFTAWERIDPLLEAVVQATEEAVVNALAAGSEAVGHGGRRVPGLPHDRVARLARSRLDSPPWDL
jgi:D-aminopeptidase